MDTQKHSYKPKVRFSWPRFPAPLIQTDFSAADYNHADLKTVYPKTGKSKT